jgi:lon-related putative ATP-dependent protease
MPITPLAPDALYRSVAPETIPFDTTETAPPHADPVGQDRAVEAVLFGIGMKGQGYNLFCMGPEGTGKASLVRRFLHETAAAQPVPDDWCYVHNFDHPTKPRALRLPHGRATAFAKAMQELLEDLRLAIPSAFETDEYRRRRKQIEEEFKERQDGALETHRKKAEEQDVALMRTPMGLALAPVKNGEVLGPDDFAKLPENEQQALKDRMQALQKDLETVLRAMPRWERDKRDQVKQLNREIADNAVSHVLDDMREAFQDCPVIVAYLDQVHGDVLDNVAAFLPESGEEEEKMPAVLRQDLGGEGGRLRRYHVNVLVAHEPNGGAPVVEEDHPIQPNLVGRIEHRQQFGALTTDFNLIRPGALHRANGGYLVVEARKLLMHPFAYDDLKRALRRREVTIEAPGAAWGIWSTQALEPEPIPLEVKVVLLGEPMLFYLLTEHDPDFRELFKAHADFNMRMERTPGNTTDLALLLATMAREKALMPLDRTAVARVIEHGSRLAEDQEKLTAHMGHLADLMREAEYYAVRAGATTITAAHVIEAVAAGRQRNDRIPTAVREEIERGTIHVACDGAVVGQVNGLAVLEFGPVLFGRPSRISARVRLGRGELTNIEREAELSGPLHSKGVMILSSFLASRFAEDGPLPLNATLVFEQSYGMIDGDSASSTELYALLSALAEIPIRQGLAVTGSVDQFGRVQAIGGVNEKIEGFFDLCQARGLTGDQGVIVPADNQPHLMLREDVVAACRDGRFHIWPVAHVDEGIELLTGVPAGTMDADGTWAMGSVNRAVAARLTAWVRKARRLHEDENGHKRRMNDR